MKPWMKHKFKAGRSGICVWCGRVENSVAHKEES